MDAAAVGRVVRGLRTERGWSQGQLADFLNAAAGTPTLTRNDVSRWENGRRSPRFWLAHLAAVFDVDVKDLASAGNLGRWQLRRGLVVDDPALDLVATTDEVAPSEAIISTMQSFRAADRNVGGGHLYPTVIRYLQTDVARRLFDTDGGDDRRAVFAAAAALTEMAGWMAHDAGRDSATHRHLAVARDLAQVSGERQLTAHVLASLSHHARHVGQHAQAVQLALDGRALLAAGPRQPELVARLLAMQARAHAEMGEAAPATQLLRQAEDTLGADEEEELSPWVSRFDEGSLASEAARSLLRLHDMQAARVQAERILQIRAPDRTRSRAFAQLTLARALIAKGEADEACAVVDQALDATRQRSSFLVIQQLGEVRQLLLGSKDSSVVTTFLPRFESELAQRSWLYDWLRRDDELSSARGAERRSMGHRL